jgi:serine/threonine-protein kinase
LTHKERERERERDHARETRTARAPSVAPEPVRPSSAAPTRVEPEPALPKTLPPPVATAANAYAAVEACRDKMFLLKESCLADACGKPGARNHPLCVKHREDVRLREDSKVKQGPQQVP